MASQTSVRSARPDRVPGATRTLALLAAAQLLAMSLWFTGTAVIPVLTAQWHGGLALASWLTIAVQLGFVCGAVISALFTLADLFSPIKMFVGCAVLGAAANALFAAVAAQSPRQALALRFATGALLAGVYPVGMKIMAGWFRRGRGLALGILVGALTVGSAIPHAVNALGGFSKSGIAWQVVVLHSSALAVIAALIVAFAVREGPFAAPSPPFRPSQMTQTFRRRRLRLANFGYLGHMWELYSLWGWIGVLLTSAAQHRVSMRVIELLAFFVIAVGAIGCVWAGRIADQPVSFSSGQSQVARRAWVTIVAMAVSGACCILASLSFHHFWILSGLSIIWGVAVVADSAQFSTIVTEVAEREYIGTALTTQTALGFLLTTISLRATAAIAERYGWQWAVAALAVGPALGIIAMRGLTMPAKAQQPI